MLKIMEKIILIVILSLVVVPESQTGSLPIVFFKSVKLSYNALTDTHYHQPEHTSVKSVSILSLKDILREVNLLIWNIVRNFEAYSPKVSIDLESLFTNLTMRISHALEDMGSELIDAGENLLRNTVKNLQKQLLVMTSELKSLTFLADGQFNLMVDHINNSLINHTGNIDLWATSLKQQLRTINNSRLYERGCQVVDELMIETTSNLQECCNIAIRPVHSLCKSVREVFAVVFSVLANIIEGLQSCLEDKHSYFEYMLPCFNVAYDNLNELMIRSAKLRENITSFMPIKIVFSKFCIHFVSVHIENGQNRKGHAVAPNMDT